MWYYTKTITRITRKNLFKNAHLKWPQVPTPHEALINFLVLVDFIAIRKSDYGAKLNEKGEKFKFEKKKN